MVWSFAEHFGDLCGATLRLLPAETAHDLGLSVLEKGGLRFLPRPAMAAPLAGLATSVPGIGELAHPICLAAGFDKDARVVSPLSNLGFSAIEIGTITPQPQTGNAKPRLFRQSDIRCLINRMGFNSAGANVVLERLTKLKWNHERVPLGINIGRNRNSSDGLRDYLSGVESFRDFARYIVINLSSPNTPGLRELASPEFIHSLADELGVQGLDKIWIKLDPDMEREPFQRVVEVIAKRGFQGIVLCNTHRVLWPEIGGQSGHAVMASSTARLEWAYQVHRGSMAMIASGGVMCGADVVEKLIRGARAVQIYSAFVYRGPWVVLKLLRELKEELKLRGFECVEDAVNAYYA